MSVVFMVLGGAALVAVLFLVLLAVALGSAAKRGDRLSDSLIYRDKEAHKFEYDAAVEGETRSGSFRCSLDGGQLDDAVNGRR